LNSVLLKKQPTDAPNVVGCGAVNVYEESQPPKRAKADSKKSGGSAGI